jgi:iron complex outermembrane receptor protein
MGSHLTIHTRNACCTLLISLFIFSLTSSGQEQETERSQPQTANGQATSSAASGPHIIANQEVVVVTGTFEPLPLEELNRAVSVLGAGDMPLLYNHWIDYLQADPSIDLRQRAPDDLQADISIRGSSFGETLVLVNGLRMDDAQSSHHDMDLPLPMNSVDRIEVLHGPGSTLYGSDAMGGAVNFITSPPVRSELRLSLGVGSFGINQQAASASLVTKKWDERLSAARNFSTGFARDRDYRSLTIFSDTGAKTALGQSRLMLGYGDKPFGADQFYGNFDSWERTKSWFAGFKQDLGKKTEFDLGYRRHSDEFILLRDQPQVYENNHVTESWQLALRRRQPIGEKITCFYGAEGDHDAIDSNNLGQHARARGAGYLDVDLHALNRFSLSLGAREEIFEGHAAQLSPTIAGGVWLKTGWKVRASASRAFRLPTYTDLYYRDPGNAGNPNLQPESAWNYEGGLEWRTGGRVTADATLFHARQRNVIDYAQFFPGDIFHAANIQRLNFTGVESSLDLHLSDVQRVTIGYTGIHGAQQSLNGLVSRYVFNFPVHRGLIGWQGMLPGRVLVRTRVGVTQRFAGDPYAVWDVALAREFGDVGVRLSFSNLADTRYEEVHGMAMPGRSVVFGLEYVIRPRTR